MPKSRFTITLFLAFLVTVAALQWWQMSSYPPELWIILDLGVALFLFVGVISRALPLETSSWSFLGLCVMLGISVAFISVARTTHISISSSVESFAVEQKDGDSWKEMPEMTLHGFIVDEPDRRPMVTKYTVAVDKISVGLGRASGAPLRVNGNVLVTDHAMWPRHAYGDEVMVTGILEKPGQIEAFSYDRYLSRYGIYAVMYRANVETVSGGHGSRFFTFLYNFKDRFEAKLNRLYPEPHASFMAGLLTGSRRGIPEHLLEDFQITGLTHIIAISGYNIAIVIALISSLLFFVPLRFRLLPSIVAILFFTLFVGASPSVVRAAIMGGLGIFALHVGRQKHSLIAILFAGACMTAWNPKVLWYDAGFQLSFLSVLGLSFLSPFLDRLFAFIPSTFGLRESLHMTVAAQLAAVPLIILLFGRFSLIAPLANIVVAPFIPLAMLFGFLGTLIGFLSEPLGLLIAYPGWGALEFIIRVTRFFADLLYASVATTTISAWWVMGYYALLVGIVSVLFQSQTSNNPIMGHAPESVKK